MKRKSNVGLGLCFAALASLALTGCGNNGEASKPPDSNPPAEWKTAVTPKPLSDNVQRGLEYLVKQQHSNGGWGQGGGWRTADQGGSRVEGAQVQDPPDVGNTCIATLALIRAGNTASEGPYAQNVAKAIEFICNQVEKADDKSIYVTDVRNTQLQSKIGPYVDTFLTSLVFAELKGRTGETKLEGRLVAALDKTVGKIQKNQREDGGFAGNTAWASVLSQGLAGKGLSRAKQAGANVSDETIARVQKQVTKNFDGRSGTYRPTAGAAAEASDAGVSIYGASAGLANSQDVINALGDKEKKAKEVLAQPTAPRADKDRAEQQLKEVEEIKTVNGQAVAAVAKQLDNDQFVAGFGSNGGEEFLSFMNISETLLFKGGPEWQKWDKNVTEAISKAQDKDGSWSGQHCITGKTFCTAGALLVLMADRTPVPVSASNEAQK
jgi:hypothetical protein